MARAGASSSDAKPAESDVAAEEPLAEWERDLLQGTPDDTVTGNAAGEDPQLAVEDEVNAPAEASAAAEAETKPAAEEAATDAADADE
jgi:small subunit ribosomal protein S2